MGSKGSLCCLLFESTLHALEVVGVLSDLSQRTNRSPIITGSAFKLHRGLGKEKREGEREGGKERGRRRGGGRREGGVKRKVAMVCSCP